MKSLPAVTFSTAFFLFVCSNIYLVLNLLKNKPANKEASHEETSQLISLVSLWFCDLGP